MLCAKELTEAALCNNLERDYQGLLVSEEVFLGFLPLKKKLKQTKERASFIGLIQ